VPLPVATESRPPPPAPFMPLSIRRVQPVFLAAASVVPASELGVGIPDVALLLLLMLLVRTSDATLHRGDGPPSSAGRGLIKLDKPPPVLPASESAAAAAAAAAARAAAVAATPPPLLGAAAAAALICATHSLASSLVAARNS
jgi:hypothetical protein